MLGWVTLQFIKAKRVLKSLVNLEPKFQEKPLGTKITTISYIWAVLLHFSVHTEGASWDRVPVRCPGQLSTPWQCQGLTFQLLQPVTGDSTKNLQ